MRMIITDNSGNGVIKMGSLIKTAPTHPIDLPEDIINADGDVEAYGVISYGTGLALEGLLSAPISDIDIKALPAPVETHDCFIMHGRDRTDPPTMVYKFPGSRVHHSRLVRRGVAIYGDDPDIRYLRNMAVMATNQVTAPGKNKPTFDEWLGIAAMFTSRGRYGANVIHRDGGEVTELYYSDAYLRIKANELILRSGLKPILV